MRSTSRDDSAYPPHRSLTKNRRAWGSVHSSVRSSNAPYSERNAVWAATLSSGTTDPGVWAGGRAARIEATAEAMAVRGHPRIQARPEPARAREIQHRQQRPQQRCRDHNAAKREEPAIATASAVQRVQRLVEVGLAQVRSQPRDAVDVAARVKSKCAGDIDGLNESQHAATQRAVRVVDHID